MENYTGLPDFRSEADEEKSYRKLTDKACWGVIGYYGVMLIAQVLLIVFVIVFEVVSGALDPNGVDKEQIAANITKSIVSKGGLMIISALAGTGFMALFMRRNISVRNIFEKKGTMTLPVFLALTAMVFGAQLPNTLFVQGLELLLNLIGRTTQAASDVVNIGNMSLSMFLYAAIAAPVLEELAFRGYTTNAYYQAGSNKILAIVMSAFIFSILHGNFTQFVFTFIAGIIFAYTAIEYGIIWSIILHFVNNGLLAGGLSIALKPVPENISTIITLAIISVMFIAALVIIILRKDRIGEYISENRCEKRYFKWSFSSMPLIGFTIFQLFFACMQIKSK